jgi:prepilin-type processing-associated H-X9-DG protein
MPEHSLPAIGRFGERKKIFNTRQMRYKPGMKALCREKQGTGNRKSDFRFPTSRPGFQSSAFSLIELLVVLVLMIIMIVMFWGFGSVNRQRAAEKACQQNLSKIYVALQIYANDFGGKFPQNTNAQTSEQVLDLLVPKYTADTSIFICPGGRDSQIPEGAPLDKYKISYAYYMGRGPADAQDALMSDRQVNTNSKSAGDRVFSTTGKPPGNNHYKYGGNFLFCDGSLKMTPPHVSFPLPLPQGVVLLNPKP